MQWQRLLPYAEYLFYAAVVFLATGAMDFMIRMDGGFTKIRAAMWGLAYLGFAGLFVLMPGVLLQAVRQGWPLLTWSALALVSYLWSVNKGETLVAGLQLFSITLFGLFVGARLGMAGITRLIFLALAATAVLSVLTLGLGETAWDRHHNLIGAYSHKNMLGNRMALLILFAAVMAAAGQWRWTAIGALVMATGLLLLSGSATALVAAVLCLGVLAVLYCIDLPGHLRFAGFSLLALAAVALLFIAYMFRIDLIEEVLGALGKDATLTGRATLWDFAVATIADRPGLGYGFDAFWAGVADRSEYLRWIVQQRLSHFHNGFLDVGVQLGVPGMILMAAVLLLTIIRAFRYLAVDTSSYAWMPMLFLALLTISNTAEVVVFIRHGFFQFILGMIFVRMALALEAQRRAVPGPGAYRRFTAMQAHGGGGMQESWR